VLSYTAGRQHNAYDILYQTWYRARCRNLMHRTKGVLQCTRGGKGEGALPRERPAGTGPCLDSDYEPCSDSDSEPCLDSDSEPCLDSDSEFCLDSDSEPCDQFV